MKLTPATLQDEFDRMLVMRPISKADPQKKSFVFEDWLRISEHWEEDPFKAACFEVRKQGGFFPSLKEIEGAYWQAVKEDRGAGSDHDDFMRDYHRRMRDCEETWAQVSSSKDLPWIMEQATDEVDAAISKIEVSEAKRGRLGDYTIDLGKSGKGKLSDILKRHREVSIRGRACQIWKETRE